MWLPFVSSSTQLPSLFVEHIRWIDIGKVSPTAWIYSGLSSSTIILLLNLTLTDAVEDLDAVVADEDAFSSSSIRFNVDDL